MGPFHFCRRRGAFFREIRESAYLRGGGSANGGTDFAIPGRTKRAQTGKEGPVRFELPPLPYAKDALEPHISAATLDVHREKHHRGYLEKLEAAIAGTNRAKCTLAQLILETDGDVFNNAAQVWNHTFYFDGMTSDAGMPSEKMSKVIQRDLGSYPRFRQALAEAATDHFGSGWAWLAANQNGRLEILSTHDADNPLRRGMAPLLAIDVWEHAYYLDYQSDRSAYVEAFLEHLIDWQRVEERFAQRSERDLRGEASSVRGVRAS